MIKKLSVLFFVLFVFSPLARAWIPSGDTVTVTEVIQWQDNSPTVFRLSSGLYCYIESSEKNAYSMVLGLYMSGNKVAIHCHDAEENKGGIMAHKMHRMIAVK